MVIKKQIKKFARLAIIFCFAVVALTACGDGDEEIFGNADAQIEQEQETDQNSEKTKKPD